MFSLLLQTTVTCKSYSFYYNEVQRTISYVHETADEIYTGTLYNGFTGMAGTGYVSLVAFSSTLSDVSVKVEYNKAYEFTLFGIGDFSISNATVEFYITGASKAFAIAYFGRGILEISNGSLAVRSAPASTFKAAYIGENLAFVSQDFVLNLTASSLEDFDFFDAVTYIYATNLSFAGGRMYESYIYHSGKRAFACNDNLLNCSTCGQHFYLEGSKCVSLVQSGMNCNGCVKGYVPGVKTESIDESLGCYKKIDSKKGDSCYFGLALESTDENPIFSFRCSKCYDSKNDPMKGCEAELPTP